MRTSENGKGIDHDRYAWARFEQKRVQNVQGVAQLQSGLEGILEAFLNSNPERHAAAVDMLEPVLREQQLQAVMLEELLEDLLRAQRVAKVELATAASAWPRARGEDPQAARAVLEDCSRAAFLLLCAAGGHCGSEEEQRLLLKEVPLSGAFCDEASFFLRDVRLRLSQEFAVESIGSTLEADELTKQLEALQKDQDDLQDMLNRGNEVLSSSANSWLCLAEKAAVTAEHTLVSSPTKCTQPDVSIMSRRSSGSTGQGTTTTPQPLEFDLPQPLEVTASSATSSPRTVSPPRRARSRSPQRHVLQSSSASRVGATPERSLQTPARTSSLRGVGTTSERRQIVRMSSAPCLQRCGPPRHASPTKRLQTPMGYSAILPVGVSSEKTKQALLRTDVDRRTEPLRSPKKKNIAAPGKPLVVTIAQRAPALSSTSPAPVAIGGSTVVPGCRARLNKSFSSPALKVVAGSGCSIETPVLLSESSRCSSFTAAPISGQRTPPAGYPAGPVALVADGLRPTPCPAGDVAHTSLHTPSLESAAVRDTSLSRSQSDRTLDTSLFRQLPSPSSQSDGTMGSQRSPCFYPPPITTARRFVGRHENA